MHGCMRAMVPDDICYPELVTGTLCLQVSDVSHTPRHVISSLLLPRVSHESFLAH